MSIMQPITGGIILKPPLPTISAVREHHGGGNRMNIHWHDEDLWALVIAAHKEGLSATQIMFRIHDHYNVPHHVSLTRNAVLGALHRQGISASDRSFRPRRTDPAKVPAASKQRRKRGPTRISDRAVAQREQNQRAQIMAEGKEGADEILALYGDSEPWTKMSVPFQANGRKTIALVELTESTCRWPFECDDGMEGKHTFCGDHVRPGTGFPYCPVHARLASGGMPPPRKTAPWPSRSRTTR